MDEKPLVKNDLGETDVSHLDASEIATMAEKLWQDTFADPDKSKAVALFQKAFLKGNHAVAGYRLGIAYFKGTGVEKNLETALQYLSSPALDESRFALYFRGIILSRPDFSGKDYAKARLFLAKAEAMGVEAAKAALQSVPNDKIEGQVRAPLVPDSPTGTICNANSLASVEKGTDSYSDNRRDIDGNDLSRLGRHCNLCGGDMSDLNTAEFNCPVCRSRPRTRCLPELLARYVEPAVRKHPDQGKPLLAFAMNKTEEAALSPLFENMKSVSLYGKYRAGHEEGVDARDLSRFEERAFIGAMGILLFDYFVELETALQELARVIVDGGVVFTHIASYRLTRDNAPPVNTADVRKREDYFAYVPDDANMASIKVGDQWFKSAMERSGFRTTHVQIADPVTGLLCDWFVGFKPDETLRLPEHAENCQLNDNKCNVCGFDFTDTLKSEPKCPQCGSPPRTRVFQEFVNREIAPYVREHKDVVEKLLLAFAMTRTEEKILEKFFSSFKSVSLFRNYRSDHETGVDARDLSRYPDASFSGSFGILLFDYFEQHDQALREAARVICDGGIFFHHINTARLTEGASPPITVSLIQKRPDYFDYVPDGTDMPSVKVGIDWFTKALENAGFEARHVNIPDKHTGEAIHWFMGIRRPRPEGAQRKGPGLKRLKSSIVAESGSGATTVLSHVMKSDCRHEPKTPSASKTYSIPLLEEGDSSRLVCELSVPEMPLSLRSCQFAEHVFDAQQNRSTEQLIMVGKGIIGSSNDLGRNWHRIELPKFPDVRFYNSFTLQNGNHLVQAVGWQGINDKVRAPETRHAQIFVFSQQWELLSVCKAGDAHWHGSASIGEKNGIIMYGDYFDNSVKYRRDHQEEGLERFLRPSQIWRSKDGGEHWEPVLEQNCQQIRHFHTVIPDPFEQDVWWASSGDLSHECHVWRSPDNGDSWEDVTDKSPAISLPDSFAANRCACHRYTDAQIDKDEMFWGADDWMGLDRDYSDSIPIAKRAGSRIYRTAKSIPLKIEEVCYVGQPVRSLIAIENGYILTTEAKRKSSGFRPGVFFLNQKKDTCLKLFDMDNYKCRGTGLSYSKSSRKSINGTFFIYRGYYDAFDGLPRILRFDIRMESEES